MTIATTQRQPELTGRTVVIIGGGAGIGLQTDRRARAEGAGIILAGRDPGLRERAAPERFSGDRPEQTGHMVMAAGPAVR